MERLIHSTSLPSKLHHRLNHDSSLLARLARVDSSLKLHSPPPSLPSLPRLQLLRVHCKHQFASSVSSKPYDSSADLSSSAGLTDGSKCKPRFLKKIGQTFSGKQKVLHSGAVILLSAIFLVLIHPVVVAPAFAHFKNPGNSGGPAAGTQLFHSELLSSAWTGFLAGCLHTLSGPDHLAALAPLSIGRTRIESAAVGALWGCGHDAGQVIFGLLFLLLKDKLRIEVIRTWGTRVVGFTLLVIGGMGIKEASEVPSPCVALENGEGDVSSFEALENPLIGKKRKIGFATFGTGIVHGLQPDALMMILPALALPSRLAGASFLFMFLVGTVVAMGSYTVLIGSCTAALKDRIPRITEKLTWGSSLIAIALGLAILITQFFGFSLY